MRLKSLQFYEFNVGQRPPEEPFADRLEVIGHIGDKEPVFRLRALMISKAPVGEEMRRYIRHGFSGVHEANIRPCDLLQKRLDQWIVGAPQDKGIDMLRQNRP
jgi:hypothetical protein